MTFARISTNEYLGEINFYTGEGEITQDVIESFGAVGVLWVPDLQDLLQKICLSGFEHHFAATRGNVSNIIEEAFEKYLDFLS